MVLRAKEEIVDKRFLPFFMQSNIFMQRALEISVGSLSPTINWKTLKVQEFLLPPKDEQRRIAEILWAGDDVLQKNKIVLNQLNETKKAMAEKQFRDIDDKYIVKLKDILTKNPRNGYSISAASEDTGYYVLTLSALSNNGYKRGFIKPVVFEDKIESYILNKGDFLISRSNTSDLVGLCGIYDEDRSGIFYPDLIIKIEVDEKLIDKRYLESIMLSSIGRRHMQKVAAGTSGSMKKINSKSLGSFSFPCPSLDKQKEILSIITVIDYSIRSSEKNIINLATLQKQLIDRLTNSSISAPS